MKEFYNKKQPIKGKSGVRLMHDSASSYKCDIVKSFLASEKVGVVNHQPYSRNLNPYDFLLHPMLKKMIIYEGDPRSNANPSVVSFTFGIIKNGLPVYYDTLSIL